MLATKFKTKPNGKKIVFTVVKYFFLVLFALFFLFPLFYLLMYSVMPDEQVRVPTSLFPEYLSFNAYNNVFSDIKYLYWLGNSLFVAVMNILGVVIFSSVTAFGLCKVKFKGQELVFSLILATVLLPGTVTSIPLYTIYDRLGWTGTLIPLWLPTWFGGGALNIFLVRQFMKGIPKSYSEAATIDGANSFTIYLRVVLPLIKPILIYLAVVTFIGQWNDFQGPLMYVSSVERSWTVSLALYQRYGKEGSAGLANQVMAVGVMMLLPCAILFAVFQKQLMEGVGAIGIKG